MSVSFGAVASGQVVTGQTVTGGELSAAKNNITFKDCIFTGQHIIRAAPNQNIIIDGGQKVNDSSVTPTTFEGQFQIQGPDNWTTERAKITFRNFLSSGGSGDGIQMGGVKGVLLDNCEFSGHTQFGTTHNDAIQILASNFITVQNCWFHNNAAHVTMVDWNNADNTFVDNVFSNSSQWTLDFSGVPRVRVEHNTIYNAGPSGNRILDDHSGNPTSDGYSIRYNAYGPGVSFSLQSGSGISTPNLTNAAYKNPANPGTKTGFALASPTNAPDGQVWGSRTLGVTAGVDTVISVYENGTLRSSKAVTLN